uniref:Uncharacterized protein n=1 Tax=Octopus bimaculoides TaxID=37653 RepID=A0A0L8G819_OCTBM
MHQALKRGTMHKQAQRHNSNMLAHITLPPIQQTERKLKVMKKTTKFPASFTH